MGQPKALLPIGEETFLGRLIGIYSTYCAPVIVVLGHSAQVIQSGVAADVTWVRNLQPERGQFSSLQTGLLALPPGVDCLFQPIDYPAATFLDVPDAGIVIDIDTPEDFARWIA